MEPFWAKFRAVKPWLQPGYDDPRREGVRRLAGADERRSTRSRSASTAAAASPSATRWSRTRSSSGRQALAKGMRFVGDPRDAATVERLESLQRRARDLGLHALLLLQRALPEGRRPARRDREARRRGDEARDRPRHGREARELVRHLGQDDGLAARDGARAEDPGHRRRRQADRSSRWASPSTARCRRRSRRTSRGTSASRARLYDLVKTQGRDGAPGSSRASGRWRGSSTRTAARSATRTARGRSRRPYLPARRRTASEEGRVLQGLPRLALGEGARHLDAGARAEGRARARRARVGHVLRRRRHPRGRARLLPAPERAHPRLRRGDRRRHADDRLQRLHAQPAPGELPAAGRRGAAGARQRRT